MGDKLSPLPRYKTQIPAVWEWNIHNRVFVQWVPFLSLLSVFTEPFSEADDYTNNADNNCNLRVLLVNRVIVGKPHKRRQNATNLTEPPCGHHSVSIFPSQTQSMLTRAGHRRARCRSELRRDCRLLKRCDTSSISRCVWG